MTDETTATGPTTYQAAAEKALDHAERAFLSCVLQRGAVLDKTRLTTGAFVDRKRRLWIGACERAYLNGKLNPNGSIDVVALVEDMGARGDLELAGGPKAFVDAAHYIEEVVGFRPGEAGAVAAAGVKRWEAVILDAAKRRDGRAALQRGLAAMDNPDAVPSEALDFVAGEVLCASSGSTTGARRQKIAEANKAALARFKARGKRDEVPVPVPWEGVSAATGGGLLPGAYIVVGATGSGKTQFALQVALHAALREEIPALYLSLEMDADAVAARLWALYAHARNWTGVDDAFAWTVDVSEGGDYEVTALIHGRGAEIEVACGRDKLLGTIDRDDWSRSVLGTLHLAPGVSTISMRATCLPADSALMLCSVELVRPAVARLLADQARELRSSTRWFADAKYGVMFHWTTRNQPRQGTAKPWPQDVDDFDVRAFADVVQQTGAGYVIFTSSWGPQYLPAPIRAIENILPGRTSERDLIGDIADALEGRGIRLMLYYHSGYPCYHAVDEAWWRAVGGDQADKTTFHDHFCRIVAEVGERYGSRVAGWFFDGAQRYYDPHYDDTPAVGPNHAPWRRMTVAAKAGYPGRIICYNPWIYAKFTDFQDYFCGEGYRQNHGVPVGGSGIFPEGHPHAGLQAHTNFPLEARWGHIDPNTPIAPPRYGEEQLVDIIRDGIARKSVLSVNMEAYEDGTVSPASLALMRAVRKAVRGR